MGKRNDPIKRQFDFDIGHLKKSPCKECHMHPLFPGCSEDCRTLDRLQTTLARGVSTTHTHSPLEPFAILLESWSDS
jgi:hypothetical protein